MDILKQKLVNAPPILDEWVGRVELLQVLDADWGDPARRIVELIGFGGEGKSSVARRWVANVLSSHCKPQAVFWWGFYENGGIDEFFEALAEFLVGNLIEISEYKSASEKIRLINSVLRKGGRYLFVLDGLEVLQHESGDDYGLLKSPDLREWLRTLAKGENEAFCVVTSRAPLFDLIDLTTFVHRDVERLTDVEGCELLQKLGVCGEMAALMRVVSDWDGYVLVLSLLATYLVERFSGDVTKIGEVAIPLAREAQYERVRQILHHYDQHLSNAERDVMQYLSPFRLPVKESALVCIWQFPLFPIKKGGKRKIGLSHLFNNLTSSFLQKSEKEQVPFSKRDVAELSEILHRLVGYRMLRYDKSHEHYKTHPLIRSYYLEQLKEKPSEIVQALHNRIKDWYLDIAGKMPELPTFDQLAPLIESVHHACKSGEYDEALNDIFWERIYQKERFVFTEKLGAYATNFAIMQDFFPQSDTNQDPLVSDLRFKSFILNEIAFCLISLGRLHEAPIFYERNNKLLLAQSNWIDASVAQRNLARLYAHLGKLAISVEAANEAIKLCDRAKNKDKTYKRNSLAYFAYAVFLKRDVKGYGMSASEAFQQAEALERDLDSSKQYLSSDLGIFHSEYLLRYGEVSHARRVTEENFKICELNNSLGDISQSHRVFGDLDIEPQFHYAEALGVARSISSRHVLIESLLGYGRWLVGLRLIPISQEVVQAISPSQLEQCYILSLRANENPRNENDLVLVRQYLDEALTYATTGGYRIYETDLRIALAWLHWREGDLITARCEAERAKRASDEMGYFWGQVDAAAFFVHIDEPTT